MKRFLTKALFLLFFIICAVMVIKNTGFKQIYEAYHYDTFNVFHWKNLRFTSAEPNKNFVKTQYIIHNPKKFNAFIFGSSRVGNIPKTNLPSNLDGKKLSWYNMTYSEGIPREHFETIKTFLRHNVHIDMLLIGFDNISMYASFEEHKRQLLRMPYQIYEKNKYDFYKPYLETKVDESIKKQVNRIENTEANEQNKLWFYNYGTFSHVEDTVSLTQNPDMTRFKSNHLKMEYTQKDAYKDIEKISHFCKENGIEDSFYKSNFCINF